MLIQNKKSQVEIQQIITKAVYSRLLFLLFFLAINLVLIHISVTIQIKYGYIVVIIMTLVLFRERFNQLFSLTKLISLKIKLRKNTAVKGYIADDKLYFNNGRSYMGTAEKNIKTLYVCIGSEIIEIRNV